MKIPFLGNIGFDTAAILTVGILGLLYFSKGVAGTATIGGVVIHPATSTSSTKKYDDQYHLIGTDDDYPVLSKAGTSVPFHVGTLSMSARAYNTDGGCVQTQMCIQGDYWDSTLCRCVSGNNSSVTTIENQILSEITHRAQNISTVIPNIETIKTEIKTHEGQIQLAINNRKSGYISSQQMQQFIEGIVTDVTTKLQIQLNDAPGSAGSVPDYYQQYYQQYQDYLNQLNNNYYNYYQPAYQYYPGASYDYYQPYQYQYPNPYYSNGQYPLSYPYYGSDQYYYYQQQPQYYGYYQQYPQQGGNGLINIGTGQGGGLININ